GTGKGELSKLCQKHLEWPLRSGGEAMRRSRESQGYHDRPMSEFVAAYPKADEEDDRDNRKFVIEHQRGILEARLILPALHDIRGGMRVLLVCDDEERYRRISCRDKITLYEAKARTIHRDNNDRRRFRDL